MVRDWETGQRFSFEILKFMHAGQKTGFCKPLRNLLTGLTADTSPSVLISIKPQTFTFISIVSLQLNIIGWYYHISKCYHASVEHFSFSQENFWSFLTYCIIVFDMVVVAIHDYMTYFFKCSHANSFNKVWTTPLMLILSGSQTVADGVKPWRRLKDSHLCPSEVKTTGNA